jgi:hypothetical protein
VRRKLKAVRKHRVNYTIVQRRQENSRNRKIVPSVSEGLHVTARQSTRPNSNVLRDIGDLQAPLGSPDSGISEYDSEAHSTFGVAPPMHVALEAM